MNRSLLHRLPALIALARERARELTAVSSGPLPLRPSPTTAAAHRNAAPPDPATRRVTLLCGDDLPVMLGLLNGRGGDGSLAGRVPLIWLEPAWLTEPASEPSGLPPHQQHTRGLLDFTTRLFVARDLLAPDGLLTTAVPADPERCVEHLLDAVFGQCRQIVAPIRPLHGQTERAVYLAGRRAGLHLPPLGGADLFCDLAQQTTRRRDPVLVMPASPASAVWVAALDRQWILVQPDAMGFALLKEHVIARRMGLVGPVQARESSRQWAPSP